MITFAPRTRNRITFRVFAFRVPVIPALTAMKLSLFPFHDNNPAINPIAAVVIAPVMNIINTISISSLLCVSFKISNVLAQFSDCIDSLA